MVHLYSALITNVSRAPYNDQFTPSGLEAYTYLGKRIIRVSIRQKILLWDEVRISALVLNELLVFALFLFEVLYSKRRKASACNFFFDKLVLSATTFRCKVGADRLARTS